jgi:hypothetical protein
MVVISHVLRSYRLRSEMPGSQPVSLNCDRLSLICAQWLQREVYAISEVDVVPGHTVANRSSHGIIIKRAAPSRRFPTRSSRGSPRVHEINTDDNPVLRKYARGVSMTE